MAVFVDGFSIGLSIIHVQSSANHALYFKIEPLSTSVVNGEPHIAHGVEASTSASTLVT